MEKSISSVKFIRNNDNQINKGQTGIWKITLASILSYWSSSRRTRKW